MNSFVFQNSTKVYFGNDFAAKLKGLDPKTHQQYTVQKLAQSFADNQQNADGHDR